MILPAFPCKSRNIGEKVLGKLPDLGEEIALKTLDSLCRDIEKVYSPGAVITIVSDGRVFADLVGVTDEEVTRYQKALAGLAPSERIKFIGLENLSSESEPNLMRSKLIETFAPTIEEVRVKIESDSDALRLYVGMARFLREDASRDNFPSNEARKRASKLVALEIIRRNEAYGKLIDRAFPEALRLSIHPHPELANKIGINLVGDSEWGTPWHNVAVLMKDGSTVLMKNSEAKKAGYSVLIKEGRPYGYFQE